jgi:hypothetical protein
MNKNTLSILALAFTDIASVYSGRAHRCCCGCSGKHYYNSTLTKSASAWRGYPVLSEEINNRMVTRVLRKIQRNVTEAKLFENDHVSVTLGNRLYVAYLTNPVGL